MVQFNFHIIGWLKLKYMGRKLTYELFNTKIQNTGADVFGISCVAVVGVADTVCPLPRAITQLHRPLCGSSC